ncbi:ectoine/hydroxyectoine ABC transporter permease subunit EhuC [Actinocatenispora thailandica]|uniref:Ectoine/hydroxyectoine ABC transporter permease subunit EhuC n=1 Tax=Actinocatenispora thailandica TaxID=227318 RepID=A0A7R7DV60_9ACTN|nr:amino acid ABC transporter permease [Actinocatenispora thailandica]BCJ38445.1 ectoine/hydroxyectoine ABC transporter permease subunit EhuC [Actinocatenispora thailandica]
MDKVLHAVFGSWDQILSGLGYTILATVLGALLALILAFILGLGSRARNVVVRGVVRAVVEFFRGTSLFVQLFWFYYAMPELGFGFAPVQIGSFIIPSGVFAGVVAFGLNFGAYGAEVVRGAINAVPKAQWEGATALNMSPFQRMRLVILPQAWVGMIPPFNNLLIQLLKSTPLLSLVLVADLTAVFQQIRDDTANTLATFFVLMLIYFVIAYVFTLLMNALETVASAKLGRGRGLRAVFRIRAADTSVDIGKGVR